MSFITEDKQLVNLLIRYGQAAVQSTQNLSINSADVNAVRSMLGNLEQKLTAPQEGSQVTAASSTSLTSLNMKNLSSLINFLGMNGVQVDGKYVVVGANDMDNDPSYVPYRFEGDQTMRPSTQLTFKVNKELLVKYLTTLQGQLVKNPNPVMKAQVDAMIHETNEQLGANISRFYQEPGQTLDPNVVVDNMPQRIIPKTQLYTNGPIVLRFRDIMSDTDLNAWIQSNQITVDDQPQVDQCSLLKFMYNRATNKMRNASSKQMQGVASMYQKQVLQLGPTFQCDLTGAGTELGQADRQGGTGGGKNNSPGNAVVSLEQLVSILPLQPDMLDFGRIRQFINTYRGIASSTLDPNRLQQVSTAMDQAEQYMQAATKNTASQSQTTFSMDGMSANDLVQWTTPPDRGQAARQRGSARALADYLEQVVRQIYVIEKDLYNAHYKEFQSPAGRQLDSLIQQQVGGPSIPFGSSLASSNMSNIQIARARLPQGT